jgi:uncharacterized membrane protein YgaE (UPF0421/DUF939 family)
MTETEMFDRPQPDPSWDYYTIWNSLIDFKNKVDNLISSISQYEDASDDNNKLIQSTIEALRNELEDIYQDFNPL